MMEDVKKMRRVRDHIACAVKDHKDHPSVLLWLSKEDAEMLHHWLNNKILYEETYGKEGTP